MPIPTNTLNIIRNSGNQISLPTYNYWQPQIVASGNVNTTQVQYPIGALPITWTSGAWSLIEVGQLWTLTSGAGENKRILSYGVVRKPATSGILYIDGKSRGDSGIASMQTSGISAGNIITVYTMRPLWGLISRIKDGQFLKQFDIPYDGSGSNPSPLVNIGSWRQAWSDKDGVASFNFTTANCFAWGSKTISSRLWTIPSGGILTSGTTTSANITVSLPEGFHIIKCTITDSGGATAKGIRPIWVNGESFLPLSEQFGFSIGSDSQDRKGRNQSVSFYGDWFNHDEFLPGTAMFYNETNYFDGEELGSNVLVDKFAGFVADEQYTYGLMNGEKATTLNIQGVWACLERIPMVSQAIVEVAAPADWTDIGEGLGIPQFINWYILKHHSNYLDMFDYTFYYDINDFTLLPDNERKLNWGMNGGVLTEYLGQTASIIAGNIGTMSDGTLTLQRDPNLMGSDYRDDLDVRMTITVDETTGVMDIINNLEYPQKYSNQTGQLRLFTLSYNGGGEDATNAFGAIAPGYYQMQAQGSSDEDSVIIKPDNGIGAGFLGYRASDQYRTNELAGHMLAKSNNPTPELSLEFVRNMDVFEPALMLWSEIDIPATWNPKGYPLNTRLLPISIDRSWEQSGNGYVKSIKGNFETESFGQPGETYTLDKGGGELYPPVTPPIDSAQDPDEEAIGNAGVLFAINQNGRIGRSKNGINWQKATGDIISATENVTIKFQDIAFDPFSPYIESGFVSGALAGWVASCKEVTTGSGLFTVLSIHYSKDVLASNIEWRLQYEATEASDLHEAVRLRSNQATQGYVACVFHSTSGNFCVRTSDGTNWTRLACGDVFVGLPGYNRKEIDFAFQNNRLVTSGYHTSSGKYRLGYFNTAIGAWTWAIDSPNSDIPIPSIEISPSNASIYATFITQSVTTNSSIIAQEIKEANPQTSSGITGSRTPYKQPTTTGDWSFSNVSITAKGDPDNGLTGAETPLVAGFSDPNFGSPSQGICYTNPSDFYGVDDGWLINDDYTNPTFNDEPDKELKFNITININGEITFQQAAMSGRWAFNSTTFSCATTGLLQLIGSHTVSCELYGKGNVLRAQYTAIIESTGNGWSIIAQQPASVTGQGNSYFQQVVLKPAGANADQNVRKVVLKLRQGTFDDTLVYTTLPLCGGWSLTSTKILIESPELYQVQNITALTPTYNIITPEPTVGDVYVPTNPYAISIDPVVFSKIDMVTERLSGGASHLARTGNAGTTWTVRTSETGLYGLRLSDEYGMAWGYNALLVSVDGFIDSNVSVLGDWQTSIDSGGMFRVLKGTLIPEHGV